MGLCLSHGYLSESERNRVSSNSLLTMSQSCTSATTPQGFPFRKIRRIMRRIIFYFLFFICFGRGTSVARCDHGGSLALSESSRGYCRSWYDAEITRNRQWRQRITEDLLDASKMYDWNEKLMTIYIFCCVFDKVNLFFDEISTYESDFNLCFFFLNL